MRLYYHPLSANSRRAVMTALHLAAPVELVLVDLVKREQRSLSTPLMTTARARLPVAELANLQAWFGRMQALDVWKKTSPPAPPRAA